MKRYLKSAISNYKIFTLEEPTGHRITADRSPVPFLLHQTLFLNETK